MSASTEKIKILVLGDSGVGKSSLVHLICHSESISSTQYTIGCSIEVKLHQYKEGTAQQRTCYIEFWDIGGSRSHAITRKIFFNSPFQGIILVQDLTNRKSEHNLKNWLGQALSDSDREKDRLSGAIASSTISQALFPVSNECDFEYDVESFAGLNIPIFVVATKLDLAPELIDVRTKLVDLLKCELIYVNCRNSKSLAPGTTNAVKLSRFLDKVCDKRFASSHLPQYHLQGGLVSTERASLLQRPQSSYLNKFN